MRNHGIFVRLALGAICACLLAAPALASFPSTDVFLPSIGRGAGVADWYTTVWVYNPGAGDATVQLYFLPRNHANGGVTPITVVVPAGETYRWADVLTDLFADDGFGALHVVSTENLVVNSRIYSRSPGEGDADSKGQFFAAVPASFAIGVGQRAQLLGVYLTQPPDGSDFRYNFGFVETTGAHVTVKVTPVDASGVVLVTGKTYNVRVFEPKQYSFADEFPGIDTHNTRLEVEVVGGAGKVIAFGSAIANGSQDPSTFEMSFRDELLGSGSGLTQVSHDSTLGGDGTASSPLGVADGGVTAGKLSAEGSASGQVLTSTGGAVAWQDAGLTLPYSGASAVGGSNPLFSITASAGNPAVRGLASDTGNYGLLGWDSGVYGWGEGAQLGTEGHSTSGAGVLGESTSGPGVWGTSVSGYGLFGESDSSIAVRGLSHSDVVAVQAVGQHTGILLDAWDESSRRFRVDGTGDVHTVGTYQTGGADFAEMLPAVAGLEPGDVLAIGADGRLMRSAEAYQTSVVGVYSSGPGFLGGAGEGQPTVGKVPVAVVGVVPVNACTENGAIRPGDMLVASSTPGLAMRAGERTSIGTVIGKALSGLASGTGPVTIVVMVR